MGCASSKPQVCENCQSNFSSNVPKSYSMHVHHKPQRKGDSHHMVALTSSTLGSLKLDRSVTSHYTKEKFQKIIENEDISIDTIEAKTWSKMIEEKIPNVVPKTPSITPPGEPETINAWELMEDLEDHPPIKSPDPLRSFSFRALSIENGGETPKPMFQDGIDNGFDPGFDPEVISTFRKALEDLPPANPFHLKPLINENEDEKSKVNEVIEEYIPSPPRSKEKLVLYFTSLRGVRKTYEECCQVKIILDGLGVKVDERDVSMHSRFKEELKELLPEEYPRGGLPKVFLGAKYIGGCEEIQQMNEIGQLQKVLRNCERVTDGGVCDSCGNIRFLPCSTCSGSCKIYCEEDNYSDHNNEYEYEEDEYGFQRCPDCNENGLIRCPICCD